MTWLLVLGVAIAAFAAFLVVFKVPKGAREAVGAALVLGVAGYAAQGVPSQPGSPAMPMADNASQMGSFYVEERAKYSNTGIPPTDRWVVIADALARHGEFADAAEILRGTIGDDSKNADSWVAMGNALVGHAEGMLTPPALYAYRKADEADPKAPGPPFFLGLALAQSGRLGEAREIWADLLETAPQDAAWRGQLIQQLARLDALIAATGGANPDTRDPRPASVPAGAER